MTEVCDDSRLFSGVVLLCDFRRRVRGGPHAFCVALDSSAYEYHTNTEWDKSLIVSSQINGTACGVRVISPSVTKLRRATTQTYE